MIWKQDDSILGRSHTISFLVAVTFVVGLCGSVASSSELSPREVAFWDKVHQIANPGTPVEWPKGGPRAWARDNSELLDPIVAVIIRGDGELPWFHALFAARIVAGVETRNALFDRLSQSFNDVIALDGGASKDEFARLTGIAKILATEVDQRTVRIINALLRDGRCDDAAKKQLIVAVRGIGNQGTRVALAQLSRQENTVAVERAAAFAEKLIDARVVGRDMLEHAEDELQSLTAAYLHALETKDPRAYTDLHAFGYRRIADKPQVAREVFDDPKMRDFVRLLGRIAGREVFDIDRKKFTASCTIGGRYKLMYVFELEGWRVAGLKRVAP